MSTTLVLYRNCKVIPQKNFCVESINSYLDEFEINFDRIVKTNVQFFKHTLNMTYKLDFGQINLEGKLDYNFNYLRAQDYADLPAPPLRGKVYYYFITNKKWISSSCVELTLKMDVVNTYLGGITNTSSHPVQISPKTFIIRQHKNRWKKSSDPTLYLPVIDMYNENINPVLFKTKECPLYEGDGTDYTLGSFYLIYRSLNVDAQGNASGPIDIFLCGDSPIDVNISALGGYAGEIKWVDLDSRGTYGPDLVIYANDNSQTGARISFKLWKTKKESEMITFVLSNSNQAVFLSSKYVAIGTIGAGGFTPTIAYTYKAMVGKQFDEFEVSGIKSARQIPASASLSDLTSSYITNAHEMSKISNYIGANGTISAISEVDRTDPKLLKIIKLPYRPVYYDIDMSGKLASLPNGWMFDDQTADFPNMLKYTDKDTTKALQNFMFLYTDDSEYESPYDVLNYEAQTGRGHLVNRDAKYETKLRMSEFFLQKMVYDSFSYNFRAEFMETDGGPNTLSTNFVVSLTMSSKFMFQLPLTTFGSGLKLDTQDYSGFIYVARNNELPIFNSEYLNYIRVGYNYDIKTRNRQLTSSIIGGVLSVGGAVVSAVAGGPIGIAGAVGLGITAVSQFSRAVINTAQADQNIAEKLKQTEMQGLSVASADDVDLMTEYTDDNKAKLVKYEVSPKMKTAVNDLFYYCGYVAGYQGIPDLTSRVLFNFVQADVIFDRTPNMPQDELEELINKFKEGITFLHEYDLKNADEEDVVGWDFEQQYENWETDLE